MNVKRLGKTNMSECFGDLIERLKLRAENEIPEKEGDGFRIIAETKRVKEPTFSANVISLAIKQAEFAAAPNLFTIELHALSYQLGTDVGVALECGDKHQLLEVLGRKGELIARLIEKFYEIDKSLSETSEN